MSPAVRLVGLPLLLAFVGCGSATAPPAPSAPAATTLAPAPAAATPAADPTPRPTSTASSPAAALLAAAPLYEGLTDANLPSLAFSAALSQCARVGEGCSILSAAAYDGEREAWVVLEGEINENSDGGTESTSLAYVGETYERLVDGGELTAARLAALRRETASRGQLPRSANLLAKLAVAQFSISSYAPLATLRAPLEGWSIFVEPSSVEIREYHAYLISPDHQRAVLLGSRTATVGPVSGDGWSCSAHQSGNCTEAEMRAENLLAVEPVNLYGLSISADRSSMLILGTLVEAGHGASPSFHWVLPISDEVRALMTAPTSNVAERLFGFRFDMQVADLQGQCARLGGTFAAPTLDQIRLSSSGISGYTCTLSGSDARTIIIGTQFGGIDSMSDSRAIAGPRSSAIAREMRRIESELGTRVSAQPSQCIAPSTACEWRSCRDTLICTLQVRQTTPRTWELRTQCDGNQAASRRLDSCP